MTTPKSSPRRPHRRWTRTLVVEVGVLLVLPVVLGFALGWYGLNPSQAESLSPVGSESHDLLNSFPYDHLVVEIDYEASGGPPPASAVSILEQRINETCAKSSVVVEEFSFSSTANVFSEGSLLALEDSVRHSWPSPGTFVLGYLYLNGADADNSNVIGLAYRGASIAVFEGTIQTSAPGGEAAAVTATVLVHEFGHDLGLVGIVGYAPNEDPNHPYHSTDPNDVMYWAVDTTSLFGGLLGGSGPPTQFDAADLADLSTVKSTFLLEEVLPWAVLAASVSAALLLAWFGTRPRP